MKKTTKTTKTAKAPKTKAAPKIEPQDSETSFRVVPLSFAARNWVAKNKATALGPNNQAVIAFAVGDALPGIVKALRAIGLGRGDTGKVKKYRLPFDPATLAALREASDVLGVPATMLLELALLSHVTKGAK